MPFISVGFTGTQHGMSASQLDQLKGHLRALFYDVNEGGSDFHHGDCIGADAQAHEAATERGYITHGHPPADSKKRAFKQCNVMHPVKPYLERNHDIVDMSDVLIATPRTRFMEQRSGTWATVRYAMKKGKRVILIAP